MRTFLVFFIINLIQISALSGQNDFMLYKQARKLTIEKKWNKAIQSYEKLRDKYPDSRYRDDADFWSAYIQEKEEHLDEAFLKYQELINKHPNSAWVDDAVIHQIFLAETFIRKGKQSYTEFIKQNLDHDDVNVRNQAAISLGKFGNPSAIPILKNIAASDDMDLAVIARKLIKDIERNPAEHAVTKWTDIDILMNSKQEGGLSNESTERSFWDHLFFETKRYKTYKMLKNKEEEWTETELVVYGLWQILDNEQFDEFFSLSAGYDRKEWLRKFWKQWDPTPTTPVNEREDEFIRRIHYARDKFGEEWNFRQFKYLTEQYLRTGWSVAPWDSRGELYVKYGEPDFRDTSRGVHGELWRYYRYDVDFLVKPYVTNIFGNGLFPGPMSKIMYRSNPSYVESEYIYNPDFRFDAYKDYRPIKEFDLEVQIEKNNSVDKRVKVSLKLSGREMQFSKLDQNYSAKFFQSYVVYDEDLKEVLTNQKEVELLTKSKMDTEAKKNFNLDFDFKLPRGYYTLALSVKDMNSDKLGIFLEEFRVE